MHRGPRPENASVIMAALLDELEARGDAARPAGIRPRAGGLAPRPGALDKDKFAAGITQLSDLGFAAYTRGRLAEPEVGIAAVSMGRWPWPAGSGRPSATILAIGRTRGFIGWKGEL